MMENSEKIKKNKEFIIIFFGALVFVAANIPGILECFIIDNVCRETIRFLICILYCIIIIPIMFTILTIKNIEKCYYYCFYVIFLLLPLGLVGQFIYSGKFCNIIILLITSFIIKYCIGKKLKEAKEVDIQYLKYSWLFVSAMSTIIFSLGTLACKKK